MSDRVVGWYSAFFSPSRFYAEQVPSHALSAAGRSLGPSPQALGLALQMGNVLLLLAALAVVCTWTRDARVVRGYLAAYALADYGHIYAAYRGFEAASSAAAFWEWQRWNDITWGNVGASGVLNLLRLATLAGLFGKIAASPQGAGGAGKGRKTL